MIRLFKRTMPCELEAKTSQRIRQYTELLEGGKAVPESLSNAYRDPDVKALLKAETADKCAYCESKITHIDYGDVEHILPKSARPDLRLTYENLTLACSVCNTKKADFYDTGCPLLNPYVDEPAEHLLAAGPMVMRTLSSDRGLITEKQLDLNRANLIERRKERIEAVATIVDQIARTASTAVRNVLLSQLTQECRGDREYSFIVRNYVKLALGFDPMTERTPA